MGIAWEMASVEVWGYSLLSTAIISAIPIVLIGYFCPIFKKDATGKVTIREGLLKPLLAFAVGGLLGDVFLHLIPHAFDPHDHSHGELDNPDVHSHSHEHNSDHSHDHGHSHDHTHDLIEVHDHSKGLMIGLMILAGILTFFVLEKIMRLRTGGSSGGHSHSHSHSHASVSKTETEVTPKISNSNEGLRKRKQEHKELTEEKEKRRQGKEEEEEVNSEAAKAAEVSRVAGYLNILADAAHNFTDGMAIAAAYQASFRLGISTTVAVLFHEVPHEVGDYAILLQSGFSRKEAMQLQFSTAIAAMMGTVGVLLGASDAVTPFILPFTAGGFIYISAVSVLPTLLENSNARSTAFEILGFLIGVGLMAIIALTE